MATQRREVLFQLGAAAAALGGVGALVASRWDRGLVLGGAPTLHRVERQVRSFEVPALPGKPTLVVARGGRPAAELVRAALAPLGGMGRFVKAGQSVAIKPNIGWDRMPAHGANTNPEVVAELVRACREAGASQVIVTDVSCNEARRCFQRSGIWRAAHEAGAAVLLPAEHRFRELRLGGDVLDLWPVYSPLLAADCVINVPVAKHHNLSRYTGAMKNWYGLLGGRRNRLHQNIDVSIADLATFLRPTLTVIDGTRVLMRNGPQGGNLDDARDAGEVIASTDPVAADSYACTLIGEDPERVTYLALGEQRGLGRRDWRKLPHLFT